MRMAKFVSILQNQVIFNLTIAIIVHILTNYSYCCHALELVLSWSKVK